MLAPHLQSKAREKFHQFALQDHMISLGLERLTCFNRWASVDNAFYDGHLGIPTAISSETSAAHVSCAHRTCHTNRFRNGQMAFQKMKEFEVCSLSPFLVGGGWLPLVPSAEVVVSLSLRLQFFSDCLPEPCFHPSHFLLYNLKNNYHGSLPNIIYLSAIRNVSSTATSVPFCWPSNAHPLLSASARNNFRSKKSTGAFLRSPNIASQTISSLRMALGKVVLPETKTPLGEIMKQLQNGSVHSCEWWLTTVSRCRLCCQAPLHIKNKRWSPG